MKYIIIPSVYVTDVANEAISNNMLTILCYVYVLVQYVPPSPAYNIFIRRTHVTCIHFT